MLWFNLSLLSAASKAANQAVTKTLTRDFSVLQVAAFGQLAAALIILPGIFLPGAVTLPADPSFHRAALTTVSLNILAIILLVEAIRRSDLSYALPFLGLTPVFSIFTAWFLRGELITVPGISGILLVFTGTLGIDVRSWRDWAFLGGRRILHDRGVQLVILVALIYSMSSVYDKTATLLSDPFSFVWYSAVIRAAVLTIFLYVRALTAGASKPKHKLSGPQFLLFFFLGITFLTEALFQMHALQTGMVAFVIAAKRLSILMTSVNGMLLFGEPFSTARLTGAGLIVAGAVLIYFAA
jgi:uncharacterized membrane protein